MITVCQITINYLKAMYKDQLSARPLLPEKNELINNKTTIADNISE